MEASALHNKDIQSAKYNFRKREFLSVNTRGLADDIKHRLQPDKLDFLNVNNSISFNPRTKKDDFTKTASMFAARQTQAHSANKEFRRTKTQIVAGSVVARPAAANTYQRNIREAQNKIKLKQVRIIKPLRINQDLYEQHIKTY